MLGVDVGTVDGDTETFGPSDGEDVGSYVGEVVGPAVGEEVGSYVGSDVGERNRSTHAKTGCNSNAEEVGIVAAMNPTDSDDPDLVGLDVGEGVGLSAVCSDEIAASTTTPPPVSNTSGTRATGICDARALVDVF
jgi:hypothetical protein